jgi:glutathione S-transferase
MTKPTVYGPVYSTYVRTTRMVLMEKGVEYDLVHVDMMTGEHQAPDHCARQPFQKVPAFEHNGFKLFETNAIAHYIDDAFPGRRIAPADLHRRSRDQQIVDIVNSYAYGRIIGGIVLQYFFADKEKGPDKAAIAAAVAPAEHVLGVIQDLISGPNQFLVSSDAGFSDLFLAPIVGYLAGTPEGPGILAKVPRLSQWWLAFQQRPCFVATAPQM